MKDNGSRESISTLSILGIVFIVLKLCKVVDWSWLWVLSPFWIPIALIFAVTMIYAIVHIFLMFFKFLQVLFLSLIWGIEDLLGKEETKKINK